MKTWISCPMRTMADSTYQVLDFLKDASKDNPKPTLEVSKIIFGKKGTKRMINPLLYKLQKEGFVEKIANENGGKPRWYITEAGKLKLVDS